MLLSVRVIPRTGSQLALYVDAGTLVQELLAELRWLAPEDDAMSLRSVRDNGT